MPEMDFADWGFIIMLVWKIADFIVEKTPSTEDDKIVKLIGHLIQKVFAPGG
jgi:hypothetical protein